MYRVAAGCAVGGMLILVVGVPVAGSSVDLMDLLIGLGATALFLALGLALLANIGLSPLFDPATGRYRRAADRREVGLRVLAIGASAAITIGMLGIGAPMIAAGLGASFDDDDVPVIGAIILGGIVGGLALAGIAGGVIMLGAAGVFAGLALVGGMLVAAVGISRGDFGLIVVGLVGIAVAVAFYYAGARAAGIPYDVIGIGAPVGFSIAYGVVAIVAGMAFADVLAVVVGVAAVASAVGWLVGGLLRRRGAVTDLTES